MNSKSKGSEQVSPISMGSDNVAHPNRNIGDGIHDLGLRLEAVERRLHQLTYYITSFEDALTHIARIPNLPLELEYDHRTNTLWAETRRKLEFNKNEAALISLLFTKSTGKPKGTIFQCSEVAARFKESGDGINTSKLVFETAKRVQKKLDEFLNTNNILVVSTKSFHFSKIALQ